MDVRCTAWLGEQDAMEFWNRQKMGTLARRRWMERSRQWLPSGGLEGSPLTDKGREEASASSRWLDTVPGLS